LIFPSSLPSIPVYPLSAHIPQDPTLALDIHSPQTVESTLHLDYISPSILSLLASPVSVLSVGDMIDRLVISIFTGGMVRGQIEYMHAYRGYYRLDRDGREGIGGIEEGKGEDSGESEGAKDGNGNTYYKIEMTVDGRQYMLTITVHPEHGYRPTVSISQKVSAHKKRIIPAQLSGLVAKIDRSKIFGSTKTQWHATVRLRMLESKINNEVAAKKPDWSIFYIMQTVEDELKGDN